MMRAPTRAMLLAALAAMVPGTLAAERFTDERLFTTAQQRERIDARRAARTDANAAPRSANRDAQDGLHESIVINGVVDRPAGPSVYWLNGRRLQAGVEPPADLPVRRARVDGDSVWLTLADGRTVRLRAGEVLEAAADRDGGDDGA